MSEFEQLHPSLQYHVVNTLGWSTLRPTQLAAIARREQRDERGLSGPEQPISDARHPRDDEPLPGAVDEVRLRASTSSLMGDAP